MLNIGSFPYLPKEKHRESDDDLPNVNPICWREVLSCGSQQKLENSKGVYDNGGKRGDKLYWQLCLERRHVSRRRFGVTEPSGDISWGAAKPLSVADYIWRTKYSDVLFWYVRRMWGEKWDGDSLEFLWDAWMNPAPVLSVVSRIFCMTLINVFVRIVLLKASETSRIVSESRTRRRGETRCVLYFWPSGSVGLAESEWAGVG